MIAIKVIIFLLALSSTIGMIEDLIERIILASKREYVDYHEDFVHGHTTLLDGWAYILTAIFWTGFYLVNLL